MGTPRHPSQGSSRGAETAPRLDSRTEAKRIAVVYDAGSLRSHRNQLQAERTRRAVSAAIMGLGHKVLEVEADTRLVDSLKAMRPDLVFSLATGLMSKRQQANVIAMLEMTDIPIVSSPLAGHVVGLHKPLAKLLFAAAGVPTPAFRLYNVDGTVIYSLGSLTFPVIVKPAHEGSSLGITNDSIVRKPNRLDAAVERVIQEFSQPALVETFISGREFTVGIVGNFGPGQTPVLLPIEEIVFVEEGETYTFDIKDRDAVKPVCPAQIDESLAVRIRRTCLDAFAACGCRDLARIDVRLSHDGQPYILEINTLPGLEPGYSELPRMAEAAGWGFEHLVGRIIRACLMRTGA